MLLFLEHMECLEDLWHDAQRDDHHPGEQQGAGEEHTAKSDLFHEGMLLSVCLRFATWHLERATLVVQHLRAVPVVENHVRSAIMVDISKADSHHDLACTLP